MIDWLIVADVVIKVLKDLAIGLAGGLLLTAAVLWLETLVERWRS